MGPPRKLLVCVAWVLLTRSELATLHQPIAIWKPPRGVTEENSAEEGDSFGGDEEGEVEQLADASEENPKVDFMIAGAQKCGTSFFQGILEAHKHVSGFERD